MNDTTFEQRSTEKWGRAGAAFQVLPDILLKKQVELGLSAVDMLVLINITMHWWYAEKKPFPRTTTIAARMGVEPRTVQRSVKKLTTLGLLQRTKETGPNGIERTVCDLSGLVDRLEKYAADDIDYKIRAQRRTEESAAT